MCGVTIEQADLYTYFVRFEQGPHGAVLPQFFPTQDKFYFTGQQRSVDCSSSSLPAAT